MRTFDPQYVDITYSVAWAHTGKSRADSYEEITTQMSDQARFLELTTNFIDLDAQVGQLSTQAGWLKWGIRYKICGMGWNYVLFLVSWWEMLLLFENSETTNRTKK